MSEGQRRPYGFLALSLALSLSLSLSLARALFLFHHSFVPFCLLFSSAAPVCCLRLLFLVRLLGSLAFSFSLPHFNLLFQFRTGEAEAQPFVGTLRPRAAGILSLPSSVNFCPLQHACMSAHRITWEGILQQGPEIACALPKMKGNDEKERERTSVREDGQEMMLRGRKKHK
jgi:hypothetical protein